jgi:hypothetical protein
MKDSKVEKQDVIDAIERLETALQDMRVGLAQGSAATEILLQANLEKMAQSFTHVLIMGGMYKGAQTR